MGVLVAPHLVEATAVGLYATIAVADRAACARLSTLVEEQSVEVVAGVGLRNDW